MDASSLVDRILEDHEHLLDDVEESEHRPRTLHNAQRAVNRICLARDFSWLRAKAEVTITSGLAGGSGNLPPNFSRFGRDVRSLSVKDLRHWVFLRMLGEVEEQQPNQQLAALPEICAVSGTSALGVQTLSAYPYVSSAVILVAPYVKKAPTLKDGVEAGVASGLEEIPAEYHETAVYEGAVMYQMRDKGDIRAETSQKTEFKEALAEMIRNDQFKGESRMPVHGAAAAMYGRWR